MERLPELLRELRTRLDLTQAKLAALLKVSLPSISRWEKGKTPDPLALHVIEEFVKKLGPRHRDLYDKHFSASSAELFAGEHETAEVRPRRRGARDAKSRRPEGPLETREMEGMLWSAACSIRGEKDAPKFKDYILPLVFIKRLSDVFEDEIARLAETTATGRRRAKSSKPTTDSSASTSRRKPAGP